ncbi:ARM REPEAT SUPERFAMILY PROTEIN [Salix koriyanagi]|uniref:ARM REPEAT SUPERFAMILY PROTEIN n=1 Tax=Salix koriyanagi TaxID=2511006 RepID=A0A9Q0VBB3_9ROSI|nr:ARM REPEAT SUPERFAMILY PROTEIN [Salix koriyanagi]
MKTHHPKLKTQPRPLFSCGFFRQCTETTLSPTTPNPPALPISSTIYTPAPPPLTAAAPAAAAAAAPPPPPQQQLSNQPHQKSTQAESSSSSSSSTTTSQSFTQWRFPLANSPLHQPRPEPNQDSTFLPPLAPPMHSNDLKELLHLAELQLTTGSETEQLSALYLLERSLVPDPPSDPVCSPELMRGVVANLKNKAGVKPATKILLALCLAEANRHVAVEAGAVGTVVEVAMELDGAPAERALAALELTCTVSGGAAELRAHALAVPVMVTMMGKMVGRGKEYAISALAVIYGSGGVGSDEEQTLHAPPEEVARAVTLALQGDCTARGRRKGAQLLKALQEYGRIDSTQEGNEQP